MAFISEFRLRLAAEHIDCGEVIAYPTEAVYGLGCDPLNEIAVMNLLALKQRSVEKGLILIASDFSQIAPYLVYDEALLNKALATWPGAVTWIMPTQPWVPRWLTGEHDSLAVRVTNHPIAKALCQITNMPLVSTSANPSTKKPAINALQVRQYFGNQAVYIFNGDTGGNKTPSAIYDAKSGARLR